MSQLSDLPIRRSIGLLILALAILVGGTWTTVKVTTEYLLDEYAATTARSWATFLADNISDLEQIAAGEQPSATSLAFLQGTRRSGQIIRYVIYNRDGYSQLVSDRDKIALVGLSEYNPQAARAIAQGGPVVDIRRNMTPGTQSHFAQAYVPALVGTRPVAIVAASVDQTEASRRIYGTFVLVAFLLCSLTAFAFGLPAIALFRRTKEKQLADRRIRFLAHHDALTGLTNRARLIERLERLLAAQPTSGMLAAMHFVDIDHFKQVNDTLGHDGGDFVLKTIAERLVAATRLEDVVARLGGDEFIVVQTDIANTYQAEEFARRLNSAVTAPMSFKRQQISVTVTIGTAMIPTDGQTFEQAMKSADLALYSGKAAGRNCIRFFSADMDRALQARLKLEKTIRDAVANDGFELHYQPIFGLGARRLIGFEALVRLKDPDGGDLISPASFIPVAEEMRLIDAIGSWVLREACRTASTWPNDLKVAVNLSPCQFEGGSISATVTSVLQEGGLDADRLELEITESLLLGHNERTVDELHRLKAMGVSIVVDDFGTGYSSLSYLWKFPFDGIKIDRSFMQGFDSAGRSEIESVVKTIIALGRALHMRVTVEGVETVSQADFLRRVRANQVQGYLFGRPVPAADIAPSLLNDLQRTLQPHPAEAVVRPKLQIVSDRRCP
jgi:diguanylate cyclase (GGDEF)-like protein